MNTGKTNFAVSPGWLLGALLLAMLWPLSALATPSFARQTGKPCSTCHTVIPQLTPFGREFKLSGYALSGAGEDAKTPPGASDTQKMNPANDSMPTGNTMPGDIREATPLAAGEVKKIDMKNGKVTLQHGDIANVMPAMTMSYQVRNAQQLEGLGAGDKVRFTLKKINNDYIVTHIEAAR